MCGQERESSEHSSRIRDDQAHIQATTISFTLIVVATTGCVLLKALLRNE